MPIEITQQYLLFDGHRNVFPIYHNLQNIRIEMCTTLTFRKGQSEL